MRLVEIYQSFEAETFASLLNKLLEKSVKVEVWYSSHKNYLFSSTPPQERPPEYLKDKSDEHVWFYNGVVTLVKNKDGAVYVTYQKPNGLETFTKIEAKLIEGKKAFIKKEDGTYKLYIDRW